MAAENKGRED